jgi:hypothetical protein
MKRFEIGRKTASFVTFTEWVTGQVPEVVEPFKELRMVVFNRTLLGCCALLVFWKQEQAEAFEVTHLSRVEKALTAGMLEQCGIKLAAVDAAY